MTTLQRYIPFFASAVFMAVVLFIIFPHYQYYVDPDGTAYLTISQRYADGDFAKAINGYWSPWSCWLTALLIKCGLAAIPASVIINAAGGAGAIWMSQSFSLKFDLARKLQWIICMTLGLFMCYAVFWQSFDDLWECFFLLTVLRIMIGNGFGTDVGRWMLCGVIGAMAYFAKAYAFPFFILNVLVCGYFIVDRNLRKWLVLSATTILVMIIYSIPWIWLLHEKYGIWTTSTSGTLNTSWYLVGHPYWKDGIGALLPPPYPDSPYYWEDPWYVNGATPHFWSSLHLMGLQVLRLGLNIVRLLRSMIELSVVFPIVVLFSGRFIIKTYKEKEIARSSRFIFVLSFLLFPLGYLLVNFESRYVWYMVPISMLAGIMFVIVHLNSNHKVVRIVPYLFAFSYLIYPGWQMTKMWDVGKEDHVIAQQLKQQGIKGSFTSVAKPGIAMQRMERIAYFSGNSFYAVPQAAAVTDVLNDAKRYGVNYFFDLNAPGQNEMPDGIKKTLQEVSVGSVSPLKIYLIR